MHTPWMFITGCSIIGWFLPEVLAVAFKVRIPMLMNILTATAVGLIAASFA